MKEKNAFIMLTLAAFIWGTSFVAIHFALDTGISPLYLIGIRMAIACIILFTIFFKRIIKNFKVQIISALLTGGSLFIGFYFQTAGLLYTTPSKSSFISAIAVVLAPIFSYFIEKIDLDKYTILGAILALAGIGFITLNSGIESINLGDILSLGAAVSFAFYMVFLGYYSKHNYDLMTSVFSQFLFAMIFAFIGSYFLEGHVETHFTTKGILSLVYLSLFCTLIAFFLQTLSFRCMPSGKAAIILSTESVFAVITSVIMIHEKLSINSFIGCGIIFVAILTVQTKLDFLKPKKHKAKTT